MNTIASTQMVVRPEFWVHMWVDWFAMFFPVPVQKKEEEK